MPTSSRTGTLSASELRPALSSTRAAAAAQHPSSQNTSRAHTPPTFNPPPRNSLGTFIFNYFVFAQIFNEFNARELRDGLFAPFAGLASNPSFLAVIAVSAGLQAIFVELGGVLFKTTGLTPQHWGYTIGLAALTLPAGVIARIIPSFDRPTDQASYYRSWFNAKVAKTE